MEVFLYNSTVCRLCGEENDNGNLLYSCEENNQNLCEIINSYLPIKVEDDGQLPRTICPGCTIQLEATVEFLNLIINGQKVIRELYQREKEYKKNIFSSSNADGHDVSEKIVYGINTSDGVYRVEHPVSLQVAGLEKPKRKRGRPPKKSKTPEEVANEAASKSQIETKSIRERNDDEEVSGKRKRKAPTRFQEAVQGKELERIFMEVGVIDGEESDVEIKNEQEHVVKSPVSKEPEVIGHIEKSGEPVVFVKNKGRGRPKGRSNQTREECAICGTEFTSRRRYMSHVASHGPVVYRCDCGEPFSTRLQFTEHQKNTGHTGRTIEAYKDSKTTKSPTKGSDITPKSESGANNEDIDRADKLNVAGTESTQHPLPDLNVQDNLIMSPKHGNDSLKSEIDPLHVNVAEGVVTEISTADNTELNVSTKTKFKCNNCDKVFSNRQSKSLHNKAVHLGEKNYACSECDARFAYPRSLAVHRVSHRRSRPHRGFACDLCGKVLNHPSSVVYHKQAEHAEQRYVCGTCGKHFRHKQLLQRHQLVHSQLRPFPCKICNATFKTKANLLNHQLLHSGVKKFTCEICKQKFAHKTSLTLHMRLHTGLKPFSCMVCGKSFSQKGNLSEHERIHTGEKPYQCSQCPRRFTTSSQHRLHARRHGHERAHPHPKCGKRTGCTSDDTGTTTGKRYAARNPWALQGRRDDSGNVRLKKPAERVKQTNKQVSLLVSDKHAAGEQHQQHQQQQQQVQTYVQQPGPQHVQLEPLQHVLADGAERVIYVTYDADDSQTGALHILDPEQAVNVEESRVITSCQLYSGSSLLVPHQLEPVKSEEGLQLLESEDEEQILLNGEGIPVTDEQGNPLHFMMQDGTKLAITSVDGKTLQVITQDGQTIPVEINGYNEEEENISSEIVVQRLPDARRTVLQHRLDRVLPST